MVFDEVVTGFRVALSGAQGYFGVVPDLTVFGKIVAGGYPAAGGVGGKKEYAQLMAAGLATGKHRAYVGGTLAANPLSCLAGYTAIREIERTNACEIAGRMGDRLCDGLEGSACAVWAAVCGVQPGFDRASGMHGRDELDFSSMSFAKSAMGLLEAQGHDVCPQGTRWSAWARPTWRTASSRSQAAGSIPRWPTLRTRGRVEVQRKGNEKSLEGGFFV